MQTMSCPESGYETTVEGRGARSKAPHRHRIPGFALVMLLASVAPASDVAVESEAGAGSTKGVLVLYDENKDFSGLALLDQSLKASLKAEMPVGLEVYTEYLDVSRFRNPGYNVMVRDFYRQKYAGTRIDVVVAVMAPALGFVLEHRDTIFPGAAVVFCGIDEAELAGRPLGPNVTGVLVKREFKPTLDLALRLHPGTRQVTFIAGTSPFNRFWLQRAQAELAEFEGRVKLVYLTDLPIESLRAEVSRLPDDSIILYLHLFRDGAGKTFSPNDALSLIAERANAPIYVFFDQYVGLGAVGGTVYSVETHGAAAGETAKRILRGERPDRIPAVNAGASVNLFDARQMRRWRVPESALPPGAVVRFRESSFWERYRWHVVGAAAVIATQAVLIFAMLFQLRRRRVAEVARRRAEAEAQQKRAELAHVSRVATLGELTAALAHELNQPLTAILSNAAAGQRFLAGPAPDLPEVRDTLADITADTQRAGEVIRRLRAMLKRGAPAELAPVDLNDVIRTVERIVRADAVRHRVTVVLDLGPDVPPTPGDAVQLQQVVLNVMLNAFAAMDQPQRPKRRLVVRTRAAVDGSHVEAEFEDSGAGIAADVMGQLFEPFVTTKRDGLGMGLSICRSILDQHGGALRAANNPAGGATFSLTLPVRPHAPARAPDERAPAVRWTKVQ